MKRYCLIAVVVAMMLSLSNVAQAWDGERKGFVLGIGVGGGYSNFGLEDNYGVLTNFKIGYAPSNRTLVYFQATNVFFEATSYGWYYEDDFYSDALGSLTVQYHFDDKPSGSFYGLGGIGYHNLMNWDESDNQIGFGARIGVGYEFARHFSVEAMVAQSFDSAPYDTTVVGVSVNVLGY